MKITGVFLWIQDPDPGDPKRPDLDPQHCPWCRVNNFNVFYW